MRKRITEALQKHIFVVSLLLHLLLLLSFTLAFTLQPQPQPDEPKPSMEVPAYVYRGEVTPAVEQAKAQMKSTEAKPQSAQKEAISMAKPERPQAESQMQPKTAAADKKTEAIHLVGDEKTPPKPLAKLLGKALATRLVYPKIAVDFNLKGTALIGFILYPDGSVQDVQLVKSSGADVLDKAALEGVRAISPLKDAHLYVEEPKTLVIGIIFSGDERTGRLMI